MSAKWITTDTIPTQTSLYLFKKTFLLDHPAKSFNITISADTRYRVYVNGNEVANGPCQGGEEVTYYEHTDCADAVKVGENTIEIKLFHAVSEQHLYSVYRHERPALYFDGLIETANSSFEICSDESFTCELVTSVKFSKRRNIMWSVAPFEEVDSTIETKPLNTEILYIPNDRTGYVSPFGLADKYKLSPRPIPLLLPRDKTQLTAIREYTEGGKYNIVFDAGEYTTAMLTYEYSAPIGCEIKLIYAECALTRDNNNNLYKGKRDNFDGIIDSTAFDLLHASGKAQSHEIFYYRAFRYIRAEFNVKPDYFNAFAARFTYNFEKEAKNDGIGCFESSDTLHTDMWRISKNTLECCAHEILVDCPFYEQQQYVMDGGLESLYAWRFSNDSSLQKKFLTDMAQSQKIDGMIEANYPSLYTQIIPGFSLYYVMAVREYLRYTGDTEFVRSLTGVCDRVLEGFNSMLDSNGLVMPKSGWRYLDWVDGWKNGSPIGSETAPMTAYCLMYATALESAAEVCDSCGRQWLSEEYRRRKAAVIEAVQSRCYDKKKGLYTDILGGQTYSQHTTIWAVLSDTVKGDEARKLMERTMQDTEISRCSFSMNYYMLRALEKTNTYEQYASRVLSGWRIMLNNNCTTWCEDSVTSRSECHGWSCAPVYEMSAMMLGVYPGALWVMLLSILMIWYSPISLHMPPCFSV